MKLTFYGAAQEVTGSSHMLSVNGSNVLLDCGLFQGRRKEAFEKNRNLHVDPAEIDLILLSHAHMDHSGNIPTLVKQGFTGPIYCTDATADLCRIMFRDCAYIQTKDVEYVNKKRIRQGKNPFEPLYTIEDADKAAAQIRSIPYRQEFEPAANLKVKFYDAGHILGSAFTEIIFKNNGSTRKLMFTGDIGRRDIPILRNPEPVKEIDYLITESTYGDRRHQDIGNTKYELQRVVNTICRTKGKLIIPAFSIGRTQHIVYLLNQLYHEERICPLPVYVDSPLSSAATAIYSRHTECWDENALRFMKLAMMPFNFETLRYTEDLEQSKSLNDMPGPMIIISASGMCEAGRVLHHLKNNIEDERNIVLIVGYMAENTLGRKIADKQTSVKIFGETLSLRAKVEEISALSAHADKYEMLEYFEFCGIRHIDTAFCMHGERETLERFAGTLRDNGVKNVHIPQPLQSFEL